MNENIKRLALEAGGCTYPDVNSMQLQYFARLLLDECIDIIQSNSKYAQEHNWPVSELTDVCVYEIEKTFGINQDEKEIVSR